MKSYQEYLVPEFNQLKPTFPGTTNASEFAENSITSFANSDQHEKGEAKIQIFQIFRCRLERDR